MDKDEYRKHVVTFGNDLRAVLERKRRIRLQELRKEIEESESADEHHDHRKGGGGRR